ncbi:MAG: hypothetical protein Q8R25_02655 [bacterium]|nr:hypothetical protein [bacterium]
MMVAASGNLKVELEGRGPLTLRPSDYVATGGEASVYRASGTSVKIYTDPHKMQRDGIVEKIKLLRSLKHQYIMAPEGIVMDVRGTPIGIYMPFAEGEPLPRVFTNAFRDREKFGDEHAKTLTGRMHETTSFTHDHNAIMVDANELNWIAALMGHNGPEPRAIDVDSWAVGRFGPKAIMPSIKDWHSRDFTRLTDWFSWGIVTFQIFTGIHPYRGSLSGYKPGDMEERMKANASVFHPGIGLNAAVRDFSCIPTPLLEWYKATFEKGERVIPPSPFDKGVGAIALAARTLRTITTASGALMFEKLLEFTNDSIIRIWPCGAILTNSGAVFDLATKRQIGILHTRNGEVIKVQDGWVFVEMVHNRSVYTYIDERTKVPQNLPFALKGYRHVRYENRLFLVTESELVELVLMQVGRPILTIGPRTAILSPKSTKWFDGVGIQEAFGAIFLVLPFGEKACTTVRVKELDGIVPLSAKAGSRFVTVAGLDKMGSYRKFELTFAADYSSYTVWEGGVDNSELNIAVLPKGVCATIVNDGELVIFVPRSGTINRVSDKQVATDMALANWNDTVVYIQSGAVWSLKMR